MRKREIGHQKRGWAWKREIYLAILKIIQISAIEDKLLKQLSNSSKRQSSKCYQYC